MHSYLIMQLVEFREAFNIFDKDGGGTISKNELEGVMRSLVRRRHEGKCIKFIHLKNLF